MRILSLAVFFILTTCSLFSETKILFIGDSITEGYAAANPNNPGYVAYTKKRLLEQGYDVTILNYGKAGTPSQGCREILENVMPRDLPGIVVIDCGIVDALFGVDSAVTKNNIESMITLALNYGAKVIVGRVNINSWKEKRAAVPDHVTLFNSIYEDLDQRYPIQTFSFLDDLTLGTLEYNQGDWLHPNPNGDHRISCLLMEPLLKLL
jgi:lysophospholipase L1-like esterase